MCVVIDANAIAKVMNPNNKEHGDYKPVFDWVIKRNGKIVYGGTKYKEELKRASRYLELFTELKALNKVVSLDDHEVDVMQGRVESITGQACDDPHIIAIINVSRCRVVCTGDARSHEHLKNKVLYLLPGSQVPSIYASRKGVSLLCNENMAQVCQPSCIMNKKERTWFEALIGRS